MRAESRHIDVPIAALDVAACAIPTATPETDGTAEWSSTTLVAVHIKAGDATGFGYSYSDLATATLIRDRFIELLRGHDAMAIDAAWAAMIAAGAVDVLQADATRCCGITGFIKTAAICEARSIPLSSHCAPSLHAHLGCAMLPMRHLEYFFDHARIESMLFDGFRAPVQGAIHPDLARPGIGVELKMKDAERFRV